MWTPATFQDGTTSDYGFGWAISTDEGQRLVSHGGGLPGFSTYIARFIDAGITVILLTNSHGITSGAIAKRIADFYLPARATAL